MAKSGILALMVTSAQSLSNEKQAMLDQHNQYRCMHGVPALTWDNSLEKSAQRHANKGQFAHSSGNYGENLAWGSPFLTGERAVHNWYDEIKDSNGGLVNGFSMNTGHYTQVVWKDTTKVGCAKGEWKGRGGEMWVCQYTPPGNYMNQFQSSVLAPSKSKSRCTVGASGETSASAATMFGLSDEVVDNECEDVRGFKDVKGHGCDGWDGYDCGDSYGGYSSSNMADVRNNCPATCNLCGASCSDDEDFKDKKGYKCDGWVDHDCDASWSGYQECDMRRVREHCAMSCGLCAEGLRLYGMEKVFGTSFGATSFACILLASAAMSLVAVVATRKLRQRNLADEEMPMVLETDADGQDE